VVPGDVTNPVMAAALPDPGPAAAGDGATFASPKSRILTRPDLVTNRFSGFRSRWTMPFSCAAASPWAI
jgi:hypothetical protein